MRVYDIWRCSKQWSITVGRTVLCFNIYGNVNLSGTWLVWCDCLCDSVMSVAGRQLWNTHINSSVTSYFIIINALLIKLLYVSLYYLSCHTTTTRSTMHYMNLPYLPVCWSKLLIIAGLNELLN